MGLVFVVAGVLKLLSPESFELALAGYANLGWKTAAWVARILPGLEIGVGLLLAAGIWGRNNLVPKVVALGVCLLSGYIVYLYLRFGGKADCQCFGDAVNIGPPASLAKNALLLVGLAVVAKYGDGWRLSEHRLLVWGVPAVAALVPLLLFPVWSSVVGQRQGYPKRMDVAPLYAPQNKILPNLRLDSGYHILAFLNPNCTHCRMAAKKMHIMKSRDAALPFFLVIGGTESSLSEFWKATDAQDLPYSRLVAHEFLRYTGGRFPLLLGLHNDTATFEPEYNEMTEQDLEGRMHP